MEVWAASQPALLASGGCLYGNLLAPATGAQEEPQDTGARPAGALHACIQPLHLVVRLP